MPTHTPAISIIVPIYNVERYLCECIDIIAQTFADWELLLVDDGSPDRSGEICDEYAERDSRIRVFHKDNGGVSSARNLGLDQAQGDFLTFVDADDWIDKDNLEVCVSAMEQNRLDVLQFPFKRIGADGKVMLIQDIVPTDVDDLPHYITRGRFNLCVWGAYMRNAIVQENRIRFEEDLKLA
jgi:glycosyltransferase involved in cell wall biosynthesis